MRQFRLLILSVLLPTIQSSAQEALHLSLGDCLDMAVKTSTDARNAKLDIQIQEAQNKQTIALAYPHVNAKAGLNYFYLPTMSFADASTFDFTGSLHLPKGQYVASFQFMLPYGADASITTSQVLFDGALTIAVKARNAVLDLAKHKSEMTEEAVRYNVSKTYYSVAIAQKQFKIVSASLATMRSMEREQKQYYATGFVEKLDWERIAVMANNLATDSIKFANMMAVADIGLKYLIGVAPTTEIVLTDTAFEDKRQEALDLVTMTGNYDDLPMIKVLNSAITLNEYNLKRYKMSALPSLAAFWAYGNNYGNFTFDKLMHLNRFEANSTVGLQLNMPIFNGFQRKFQIKESKLNIDKAKNSLEGYKTLVDFQTQQAKFNISNAVLQFQNQKRNLELSKEVLDLSSKKYKAGVGSSIEVTQAQQGLLQSQNNYFSALMDLISAEIELKKVMGLIK